MQRGETIRRKAIGEHERGSVKLRGEWEAMIPELERLWAQGLSTPKIARALGVSKNAVVGKIHRLNLPCRPSPIIRDGRTPKTNHEMYVAMRARRATLPPLASQASAAPPVAVHAVALPESIAVPNPAATAAHDRRVAVPEVIRKQHPMLVDFRSSVPARVAPLPKILVTGTGKCRFPLWATGAAPNHKYCDAAAILGQSWCAACRKIVYGAAKREDAA
jgi:GcrA cell cycle regulator